MGAINNLANREKAILGFEHLGQLRKEGLDFVFKGGSAIQVILQDRWTRLSVDMDICSDASEKELLEILENIYLKFNKSAFSFKPRDREIGGAVPFYLYHITAPSITEAEQSRTFLLDVIGIKPKYATTALRLKTAFFESDVIVTVPTPGALLGDKLTTVGPTTMGRHLIDSRNGVEYAKHFYDIKYLQETDFGMSDCVQAFREAIALQSKIRGRNFLVKECCDSLFTCQVASLPQTMGAQLVEKTSEELRPRALTEFKILQDGLARFRPFLVQRLTYSWDDLRYCAALTALLMKMVQMDLSEDRAKFLLRSSIPSKREDVKSIVSEIESVPEKDRWFINSDEIVNFPKVLKTWHSFFALGKS